MFRPFLNGHHQDKHMKYDIKEKFTKCLTCWKLRSKILQNDANVYIISVDTDNSSKY